jgi:hypothetical protein
MRVYFIVRNDIVFGLKFVNNVYKMLAKGSCLLIQLTKMKTRWVAFLRNKRFNHSICLGLKLPQASWLEAITKARVW